MLRFCGARPLSTGAPPSPIRDHLDSGTSYFTVRKSTTDSEGTGSVTMKSGPPPSSVSLTDGRTHYELSGHREDPDLVLLHGLTSAKFIWHYQLDPLVEGGSRVLRYDLFGRGHSDRPRVRYNTQLFVRQLSNLLDELTGFETIRVAGLSLGGAIAAEFTRRHPERVDRLALIAPAGVRDQLPLWVRALLGPGLGEVITHSFGPSFLRWITPRNLSSDRTRQELARRNIKQSLDRPGYPRSLLSTLRHGPVRGMIDTYREVGRSGVPVEVFWSRTDRVVPFRLHQPLLEALPGTRLHDFESGRHTVNFDRPGAVNPPLVSFLTN